VADPRAAPPALAQDAAAQHAAQIRIDREVGAVKELALEVGQNRLLILGEQITRASVADPRIADIKVILPTQLLLTARSTGSTDLTMWNRRDEPTVIALQVTRNLDEIRKQLKQLFPQESITVLGAGDLVVLGGDVSDVRVPSARPRWPSCTPTRSRISSAFAATSRYSWR
jgi:pilus assembly protein CpaC